MIHPEACGSLALLTDPILRAQRAAVPTRHATSRPIANPEALASVRIAALQPEGYVREVPLAVIDQPSLDRLVGDREQCGRNCETERFGGLEVDHQAVLGRELNW
jgi:hypothetical protein